MELKLNREFAMRHLGVAALMAALGGWFSYDGAVKYPSLTDEEFVAQVNHGEALKPTTRQTAVDRQFQFAGLAFVAAFLVAGGVLRAKRKTLAWDNDAMVGSLTGGAPLRFADVASLDRRDWEKKGILVVVAKDGRRVPLDSWHHVGVKELAAKLGA